MELYKYALRREDRRVRIRIISILKNEEPVVPELPKTGAADVLTGVIGIASVATAAGYYIASRKQ